MLGLLEIDMFQDHNYNKTAYKNNMRKLIYNIIKYPLIIIFLKTPLIKILKKRFALQRSLKTRGLIMFTLDTLFEREYVCKIKGKELKEILNSTVDQGAGRAMAEHYYAQPAKNLETLKIERVGLISGSESRPIFKKIINFIKINKLDNNNDVYLIQLGSSSGRDLEFFHNYYPKLNYISTDINNEILNFQKEKYNYKNFKFYNCSAEDIDKCINNFKLEDKTIIMFSVGSLQYVIPSFLEEFFSKIYKIKKLNLYICDPVNLPYIDSGKDLSKYRGKCSFSHRYGMYAKKFEIIEDKIIRPYDAKNDLHHKDVGHHYLHIKT